MFTTTSASVDREIGFKGFGFVIALHDGVEINIFVREERLTEAGLKTIDFKEGELVSLDYEKNQQGLYRAVKIHSVGSTHVKLEPTFIVVIDQFLDPVKIAENLKTGEILWRVENRKKEIVQYIVCDLVGNLLRQLGRIASNDARLNIGLDVKGSKARVTRRREKDTVPELLAAE